MKEKYNTAVIPEMKKKFNWKNDLEVPRIEKVVVNAGIGKYIKDGNLVKDIVQSFELFTGQKAVLTKSRKSIAGFKIREGQEVGAKTTLRGKRKWDFIDRLVGAAIPRIRDFQGIKESAIDKDGNLNIGIKEHTIFPEIAPENVKSIINMQVNITTTAKNRKEGMELFRLLNFPIKFEEKDK
jgi:large subunit ribosomal protein L5